MINYPILDSPKELTHPYNQKASWSDGWSMLSYGQSLFLLYYTHSFLWLNKPVFLLFSYSNIPASNVLRHALTSWYISTPFTAGQAPSDRGTNHSISWIAEVPNILSCPVILALADNSCIVWFAWVTAPDQSWKRDMTMNVYNSDRLHL